MMNRCGLGWVGMLQAGLVAFAAGAAVTIVAIVLWAYVGDRP